eukprot:GEMP01001472.1.p1 GENE.GEMP01001472.1~~GEMP01001472.1.p1  ORF type:complete len:561 (+),score=137.06 GEMP01001472.1:241-1923(+)
MPWLGPVREEYVYKLGLKLLQGLIGEKELLVFPRNRENRPRLLREGYMRRLLLQEMTLLNSPSSDIVSAQPDLKYLSLAQTLKLRVIHVDFDSRTATQSQAGFFTSLDNRLKTALIEHLGDPSVPPKLVNHFVLVFGARAYMAEKEDRKSPSCWLINLPPHRFFVNTDTGEVTSSGPPSVMAYRSYTRMDPTVGSRLWQWQTLELTDGGVSWTDRSDANEGTRIAQKIGDEAAVASHRRGERLSRRRSSGKSSGGIRRPSAYLDTVVADTAVACEAPPTVPAETAINVDDRGDAQSAPASSAASRRRLSNKSTPSHGSAELTTTHQPAPVEVRSPADAPLFTTFPQVAGCAAEPTIPPGAVSRVGASLTEESSARILLSSVAGEGGADEHELGNLENLRQKSDALQALVNENDEILDSIEKALGELCAIGRQESNLVDAYDSLDKERVFVPTPTQEGIESIVVPRSRERPNRAGQYAMMTRIMGSPQRRVLSPDAADIADRAPPNLIVECGDEEDSIADEDVDEATRRVASTVQLPALRPNELPASPGNLSEFSWFSLSS